MRDTNTLANDFEEPQRWREARAADRLLALRCAAQSFFRAAVHPFEPGAPSLALSMMEMLLHQGCDAALGGRSELFRAFCAQASARVRFALPGSDPDENYRRFCRLLETTARLARVRALLNRPAEFCRARRSRGFDGGRPNRHGSVELPVRLSRAGNIRWPAFPLELAIGADPSGASSPPIARSASTPAQ